MKNIFILLLFTAIGGMALVKGLTITERRPVQKKSTIESPVPYIGRVQILNGCGSSGAAHGVADFLRQHHFDVKNIGNADNWNHSQTLVVSRTIDTTVAVQVAEALSTKNIVLIRNQETRYDVTVIIGNDYRELIK